MNTARKQVVSGSVWTIGAYGATQVMRLGSNLVLAHLLFPAAFGIMALVTVVLQGIQMISEMGIGPSVIQNKRGEEPAFLNTAFTLQAIRGLGLWIAACLAAWPAAAYFGRTDPLAWQLIYILPVIGFTSVLGGINSTAVFTLNRKMAIREVTLLEVIPQVISVVSMLLWAWIWPSIWALVGGWLVYSVVRLGLSHWLNREQPNWFAWEKESVRELLGFGLWIFLGTLVAFLASNLDRVVLASLLSLEELGLYSIGMTLARVAIEITNRLANTVLFPVLARSRDEPEKMLEQCLRARHVILLVGGALCCAFAVVAPLFFEVLYDPRYAGAGRIASWMTAYVWGSIVVSSMERVPLALGHPRALFFSNLLTTAGYGLAIPGYFWFGIPGFLLALAASSFAAHGLLMSWVPVRRRDMLAQTGGFTLIFGLYGVAVCWATRLLPQGSWPYFLGVAGAALVPVAIAGWLAFRFSRMKAKA